LERLRNVKSTKAERGVDYNNLKQRGGSVNAVPPRDASSFTKRWIRPLIRWEKGSTDEFQAKIGCNASCGCAAAEHTTVTDQRARNNPAAGIHVAQYPLQFGRHLQPALPCC
jgi:hypothetical protein